ncbi:MAG TPA: hypothetical protein VMU40_07790 [Steroidobacteraceae bacterium]|nr:hypothetical protein [Steroidobacteraceae bacterium]
MSAPGMTEHGFRTRCGLLLNCCCTRCKVWLSEEFLEFDGMPHACHPPKPPTMKPRNRARSTQQAQAQLWP